MNSVANTFAKIFGNKKPEPISIQIIMWIIVLLMISITCMTWVAYAYINEKKDIAQELILISGSFNAIITLYLLLYAFVIIKYKIGPGGMIGEYNMTIQYNNNHIGTNFWILILLVLNMVSTGLFFCILKIYFRDKNEEPWI